MSQPSASIGLLLAHELRLTWRQWFTRKQTGPAKRRRVPPLIIVALVLLAVIVMAGIPVARGLQDQALEVNAIAVLIGDAVILFVFTLMLSQTLVTAVQVFYDRGDFDLLLSSPTSPTRILAVRTASMAINPTLLVWALATPFVLPMAVYGHPEFLAVYPVGLAVALLASAAGIAIALFLFRTIGPRRTRTVAQVLAALIGALFVIVANLPNMIASPDESDNFWIWLSAEAAAGTLEVPGFLYGPTQALFGEPVPLLIFLVLSLAIFTVVALVVGRRFAENAAAAQGAGASSKRPPRRAADRAPRFGATASRAILTKEFRLLLRDPGLISQVLLRVFYLIPVTLVIMQTSDDVSGFGAAIAAGAITLLAGQLAGSLAWITISAEDSPQLLAVSPIPIRQFWRAKLMATLVPPAIMVAPAVIGLALFAPLAAVIAAVGAVAAAGSAGLVNLWLQKPARRQEFRRQWSSSFAPSIMELVLSLLIAVATGLAAFGLWLWAAAPAGLALAALILCRRSEAAMQERLSIA
ncbi:MAG: hypothetical protein KIS96_14760 [Bauldia sp.]|nr:hypothetical protein [Bauldia sp.]